MSKNGYFTKSAQNAIVAAFCQILTLALSFVTRSVFIRYLSVEYLGVGGLFSNILTILSFSELGIGNVMIYSLYEPLKKNDKTKLRALIELYKKAYRYIALTILIIGVSISPFVEFLVKEKPNVPEDIRLLFLLYLLNTVSSYLCTYKKSLFLADQKTYIVNAITSVSHIALIIAQIAVLFITKSFVGYLICQICSTLLVNIYISKSISKRYADIFVADIEELSDQDKKTIWGNIKALAISKVSGIISSGTDNIIISRMFGLIPVGLVSNYTLVINSVNNVFYNAFSSISSTVGSFNVDSDTETKQKVFDELFMMVYLVYSFICCCLFVLIQPFVFQWLGTNYIISDSIIIHIIMGIYVGGVNYPIYSFRTTCGYFKEVKYIYVACAFLNIILSIVLGKIWGVSGVFAATWISKLILTETADSYYTYHVILLRQHVRYFFKYLVFFSIFVFNTLICRTIINNLTITGWVAFIIKCLVCGFLNVVINSVVFYHRWEFRSLLRRITHIIRRRK